MPSPGQGNGEPGGKARNYEYESDAPDSMVQMKGTLIGEGGMKIDREMFHRFEKTVQADGFIRRSVESGQWDIAIKHLKEKVFDRPEDYFNLQRLRRAAGADRRLSPRELLEKAFGLISRFQSKNELLEDEFNKFIADRKPEDPEIIVPMKYYFKAYITDNELRQIVENKDFSKLYANSTLPFEDYKSVPEEWREIIPEYIKDYVSLNPFID